MIGIIPAAARGRAAALIGGALLATFAIAATFAA